MKDRIRFHKGFSLIETVIYVAILAVLSVLVVNTILIMFSAFTKASILRRVTLDGETAFERITREIRLASSINDGSSILNVNPSRLALNTVRSATDSTSVTKQFYVSSGRLVLQEDSNPIEYLISPRATTTSFIVSKITTTHSQVAKISLTLEVGKGSNQVSRSFFNTVILRGSY